MYKILQRYLRLQNVTSTGAFRANSLGRWENGLPVFEVLQGCVCVWFLGKEPGTIESGNIALFGLVILLQIKWKNFKNFLRLVLSVLVVVSFLYWLVFLKFFNFSMVVLNFTLFRAGWNLPQGGKVLKLMLLQVVVVVVVTDDVVSVDAVTIDVAIVVVAVGLSEKL